MKRLSMIFLSVFFISGLLFAQDNSREQKFHQIRALSEQIDTIVKELLLPSVADIKAAESNGLNVFRIMPREIFGREISHPSGGGAYYSFTEKSNEYGRTPQIELQRNNLGVGFSGADYGLIADLGDLPLDQATTELPEIAFLTEYKAPANISIARAEYKKVNTYKAGSTTFSGRAVAVVGHTYILRAITFERADILIAFKVTRKDTDGSLIIYWRQIADFGKPHLDPSIREN